MTLKYLSMSAAMATLIAGGAIAQDSTAGNGAATTTDPVDVTGEMTAMVTPEFDSIEEMTVGDALGMLVYEPSGDQIGEIDYVVNAAPGAEAVIGIGGFLGIGEYTVALPLDEFELREDGRSFEIDAQKANLEQMPEFDETGAESLPDETMIATLIDHEKMPGASSTEDSGTGDTVMQ